MSDKPDYETIFLKCILRGSAYLALVVAIDDFFAIRHIGVDVSNNSRSHDICEMLVCVVVFSILQKCSEGK